MVLSSMQLQKVSVTLWFRRLQCLVLRSVLSVFINLRSAECVYSYYGLRVCYKQINWIKFVGAVYHSKGNPKSCNGESNTWFALARLYILKELKGQKQMFNECLVDYLKKN